MTDRKEIKAALFAIRRATGLLEKHMVDGIQFEDSESAEMTKALDDLQHIRDSAIVADYRLGKSQSVIARKWAITRAHVCQIYKDLLGVQTAS
jgi:DNA-directed RNA polymerase specialized sigma subunit